MPELSDQQLKDRVQKLENLLRVINGSIVVLYVLVLYLSTFGKFLISVILFYRLERRGSLPLKPKMPCYILS